MYPTNQSLHNCQSNTQVCNYLCAGLLKSQPSRFNLEQKINEMIWNRLCGFCCDVKSFITRYINNAGHLRPLAIHKNKGHLAFHASPDSRTNPISVCLGWTAHLACSARLLSYKTGLLLRVSGIKTWTLKLWSTTTSLCQFTVQETMPHLTKRTKRTQRFFKDLHISCIWAM